MKRINYALLAFATFVAIFTLAGCGDNKQVAEVKALAFSYPNRFAQDPNLTVDQALDTRNVCDSVKWVVKQTDRNQTFVEYTCDYKGVADSGFIERDKSDVASAGDVYQWTYGTDGEPELSYVGVVLHYKNGTSKDFKYDATSIMRVAADNKAANFDDAWSVLRGQPIPIKPALPFTDTTYGNTLTALYPGQSAMKAAAYAYMWKGAPTSFYIFGIDALGYPAVEDSAEAKALVFPVNPADVQIATKVDPSSISTFGAKGSGHWARYLVGWPVSTQGFRWVTQRELLWTQVPLFQERMRTLLDQYDAMADAGEIQRELITFSDDAKARWFSLARETEWMLRPGDYLHDIHDFASKAMEILGRLAAVLHTFNGEQGPITLDTLERAFEIIKWHVDEYKRLFSPQFTMPQDQIDANEVARYLHAFVWQGPDSESWIAKNHLLRNGPARSRNRLNAALRILYDKRAVWFSVDPKNKRRFVNLNDAFFASV